MKINKLRSVLVIMALMSIVTMINAANFRQVSFAAAGDKVQLLNNSDYGFELNFKVHEYNLEAISTQAGTFDQLSIEGYGYSNRIGEPQLPVYSRLIAVPLGANVTFDILNRNQLSILAADTRMEHQLFPVQPSLSKSADPALAIFQKHNDSYLRNELIGNPLVAVEEIGMMRGVRVYRIDYSPIRYNPVSGELQITSEAAIRISFNNPDFAATEALMAKTASSEFDNLYAHTFLNWDGDTRASLVRYPTKMLILCPPNYTDEMAPFVEWKKQQGYNVLVTTVGTGGTVANTVSAIKTYMTGVWSAATAQDPAPTYLLIVGDTSTSGNNIIASPATVSSPNSDHVTDNYYVRLQGTDYVPEMYQGRFSVSSATELTNIVNKTITFEKTQMSDLSYLGKAVMIAGQDATYGPTHGDGAIKYGTQNYFNTAHGITSNTYLYAISGTSDAAIIANANEGRGYINYTAHGNETGWYDPAFSVSNVNSMTNTGKYGIMVGNCCLTNAFDTGVCFGEAIIRKANAGGVLYIGGTNSTYWDEDYWWAVGAKGTANGNAPAYDATKLGAYDAMFHTHGEAVTNWATTTGDVIYMGNAAVVQGLSSIQNYYWEIYSIMGDPSLMPYFGVPTANSASYPTQIIIGNTTYAITGAAPYSRIGLSMNGVSYGSGVTDASGNLTLTLSPFSTVGTAKLVITAQNKLTRIVDIPVIAAEGPSLNVDSVVYDDSNNDQPDYNESGYLDVVFENVGVETATNISTVLSCSTAGVTITDNSHSIASLTAGASTTADNAYRITIANNIADGTVAQFTITMTMSGETPWTHNFNLELNAPSLAFGNITVSDPSGNNNSRLDPGETATITIPLNNAGGAASLAGNASLSCATSGITVINGSASFAAIAASGTANLSFTVSANASMTVGTVAAFVFNATSGTYTANKTENVAIGLILEDFETGNFSSFPWIMNAYPWTIVNSGAHTGTYAAKSGNITHSQSTTMETTRILSSSGTLSFWYKVSSESGYDYLKFYVDGVMQNQWSGSVDWTQATYPLTAGTRVLKWEYMKDSGVDGGSDCAWIDDIIFPASTTPSSFFPPQNFSATPGNGLVNLAWQAPQTGTPTGYKIFRNSSLLTTVTGLSYTDNAVVNETSYSYYLKAVYSGGESDPTPTITVTPTAIVPTVVIIGTGTSSTGTSIASPINVYYQSLHGQAVYTAAELNAAGVFGPINITQVGFNVTGLPTLAMPNYVVRLKHTSAANVASWIDNTGLSTVYSVASYQPTTTGYNMLTLSTPFLWNGTDNILIDTAFGLIGSWNSSGTVQYSTVTNGYLYTRNDTVDQTNVFSGGFTSNNRPNVKLTFQPNAAGPMIAVNPTTLAYGNVIVGTNSTQQFVIHNAGDETLTGSISTPAGYTVAQATREAGFGLATGSDKDRNTLAFSINAGSSKTYNLVFAPTASIAYNGNAVLSSNATNTPTLNIAISGSGYIPPTMVVDATELTASLVTGEESEDFFTISNTGSQALTYNINVSEMRSLRGGQSLSLSRTRNGKSIAGSTLILDVSEYTPGTTQDWTFTVENASTDAEWLKDIIIVFPATVTVNSTTNFVGGSGGDLTPDVTSGAGITITWHGETTYGYGLIQGNESASATVNVTPSGTAPIVLDYTLNGDVYGSEPHTLSDSITLTAAVTPVEWFSATPLSGSINPGANQAITGHFSAVGMESGLYEAILTIHSNDPVHPTATVQLRMEVNAGNHAPVINLPDSFSFDKNGSLVQSFASYISDADNDPLTLSCSGNTHITVNISGTTVSFGAAANWVGSEVLSFGVSDGSLTTYDNVTVTVNPVNNPGWTPVVYPNNPATLYAVVTIDNIPAQLNDIVAAFVGNECRGVGEIVLIERSTAYTTMLVNLAATGETVSFKIYAYAQDTIYPVADTMPMNFGAVYGDALNPILLNGSSSISLATPVVSITTVSGVRRLSWSAITNANRYRILASADPEGTYTQIGTTANTYWIMDTSAPRMFYKVIAEQYTPAKGSK